MEGPLLWSFIMLGIAIVIVFAELIIPSGGMLGVAAFGCVIASIVIAFSVSTNWGFGMIMIVGMLTPVVFTAIVRVWPRTPIGRMMMSRAPGDAPPDVLPDDDHHKKIQAMQGRVGVAVSDLLPNGVVEVDGERFDAVAQGGIIDTGQRIEVTRVDAGKIHVRVTTQENTTFKGDSDVSKTVSPLDQPIDQLGIESLEDPLA